MQSQVQTNIRPWTQVKKQAKEIKNPYGKWSVFFRLLSIGVTIGVLSAIFFLFLYVIFLPMEDKISKLGLMGNIFISLGASLVPLIVLFIVMRKVEGDKIAKTVVSSIFAVIASIGGAYTMTWADPLLQGSSFSFLALEMWIVCVVPCASFILSALLFLLLSCNNHDSVVPGWKVRLAVMLFPLLIIIGSAIYTLLLNLSIGKGAVTESSKDAISFSFALVVGALGNVLGMGMLLKLQTSSKSPLPILMVINEGLCIAGILFGGLAAVITILILLIIIIMVLAMGMFVGAGLSGSGSSPQYGDKVVETGTGKEYTYVDYHTVKDSSGSYHEARFI